MRLNNEEVDELVEIASERVKGFLGDGVVLSWADLGDNAGVQQELARGLSQNGNKKSDPGELKSIAQDIKVSGCEDEGDKCSISNSRSSGVVP